MLIFLIQYLPVVAQLQNSLTPFVFSYKPQTTSCIPDSMQRKIDKSVRENIDQLVQQGKLHLPTESEKLEVIKFIWPLKNANTFTDLFSYVESNYVDQDPSGGILDWNCGERTYNGHNGTDISLWPFPWNMMDDKNVKVAAAAAGTIVDKHDGEYDRICYPSGQAANYVVIQHANGWQTVYYHLKKGTVTSKAIGAAIDKGEIIGYVGSSGNSTGVHLHFGVLDESGNVVDPYKGSCNTISQNIWKTQPPYWRRSVHKIMVTTVPTVYPECPNPEQVNEMPTIPLGLNGYFFGFFSDIPAGDTIFLKILKPDNSVWQNYYYVYPSPYIFAYAYWIWYFDLSQPKGTWKWKVTYNGITNAYNFTVTDPISLTGEMNVNKNEADPNAPVILNMEQEKMLVFPSPAAGNLQVQFICPDGLYELDLCNELGMVIKSRSLYINESGTQIQFEMNDVQPGIYQLHLHNQQTDITRKVVVQ